MPTLTYHDDAIKLFPLGFVHCHNLHAWRVVDTTKNLVLRKRSVQYFTGAGVLPIAYPYSAEVAADALPPIECHEVVQILRHLGQVTIVDISKCALDPVPVLGRIA